MNPDQMVITCVSSSFSEAWDMAYHSSISPTNRSRSYKLRKIKAIVT